jgi:predicted acylesterase/phospholipase RssA
VSDSTQDDREEDQLRFQRVEAKLIRALYEHPGTVSRATEHQLRYALTLASLDTFQPGAAIRHRRNTRPDVQVRSPRLGQWRRRVRGELSDTLLKTRRTGQRVSAAAAVLAPMLPQLEEARNEVVEKYVNEFSARELDQELGTKTLVSVAGGGGGSAYVYIGAWDVLQGAGLVPGYVIGASMGAVLGLFRALRRNGDFGEYLALAKRMKREDVFRIVSLRARYGLPGILRLYLHAGIGSAFQHEDGTRFRLSDLEIPYDAVVAGLRRDALQESEERGPLHHLPEDKRPGALELRARIAAQLVRLVGFINPRVVREIVLGIDSETREFDAVDAAGFSSAIPGILHYDVTRDDPRMHELLDPLMEANDVGALVDGGVANNVPVRTAWRQVQGGRIGTRNAYYLAFDSFHPQLGLGHVWMQPITRAIAYQVALNDRYAQRRIDFRPTLSPINLLPQPKELDEAVLWGRERTARELPLIQKFFERVRWVSPSA